MSTGAPSRSLPLILAWSVWHPDRPQLGREAPLLAWLLLTIMVAVSLLMVSTVRYQTFKKIRTNPSEKLMVGAIVIGLAVDDTIHFMHNFRRYYEQSGDALAAIHRTMPGDTT